MHQEGTIGSDHYPIYSNVNIAMIQTTESIGGKWIFEKAKCGDFMTECDKHFH